nr:MAG TPA: hypothetical protein [Caudoviricetes sp.]
MINQRFSGFSIPVFTSFFSVSNREKRALFGTI